MNGFTQSRTRPGRRAVALALLIAVVALAGGLVSAPPALHASSNFSCGPNTATYAATRLDGSPGLGVRCLVYDSQDPNLFYWYGEGRWGDFQYRHMGFGRTDSTLATASDIQGGGANVSLAMSFLGPAGLVYPNEIDVEPWHERWTYVVTMDYTPLPPATNCGPSFTRYFVFDATNPNRPGDGLRCVMNRPDNPDPTGMTLWYGHGYWDSESGLYTNIGLWRTGRTVGEAVDLCFGPGGSCGATGPNGLQFTTVQADRRYTVGGAWNEVWCTYCAPL